MDGTFISRRYTENKKINHPLFVASNNFFNTSSEILGCPIMNNPNSVHLHIWMTTENIEGYIHYEKLALLVYLFVFIKNRQITN